MKTKQLPTTMRRMVNTLNVLGIKTTSVTLPSAVEDGAINLGGEFDGIHIQTMLGGYAVVRETEGGKLKFIAGAGDLMNEILLAAK